jgi:hypothetical protein
VKQMSVRPFFLVSFFSRDRSGQIGGFLRCRGPWRPVAQWLPESLSLTLRNLRHSGACNRVAATPVPFRLEACSKSGTAPRFTFSKRRIRAVLLTNYAPGELQHFP